ncbi:mammalian cell entry protein [Mycobacterium ostraviense]|uniref:Mammalian cell entry protein n=1 Tax=Mycobacterium ostraviense TaxID=2738409 RepID=A0A164E9H5_9MYCO|nr:mammalian cell entry protein [Mycobacterium ostraviense]KZS67209.1 mammalian cell entry protein [Mycobacterium ostraviense]UGT90091.1 mammalian cell entry protein [Mycobacterium ostraviense]
MAVDVAAPELSESAEAPPSGRGTDRPAVLAVLVVVLALATLVAFLGFRVHQSQQTEQRSRLFLQAGRQGALNLTTIDFHQANADVQRILDGATGQLYDNFAKRSQPYIDVVVRTQSKSVGTVTEAALESPSGDHAQVLVAVTVKTSNIYAPQEESRSWRMRLWVQRVGAQAKVSNVEFVP